MTELINKIHTLQEWGNFLGSDSASFGIVEPKQLKRLSEKILSKDTLSVGRMPPMDLKKLGKKVEAIFRGKDGEFDWKERRNLPFLISNYSDDISITAFILNNINFNKISGFRRSVFAYFMHYSGADSSELLRKTLIHTLGKDGEKLNRIIFLKHNNKLLDSDGVFELANRFEYGIRAYLHDIEVPLALYDSRFVLCAIKLFFYKSMSTIGTQMSLLQEVQGDDAYRFLIPQIIAPLIISIHADNNQHYREMLMQIVHKEMGDPRNANKASKWTSVNKEARKIYLSWLKENDLELFFEIIDSTACDRMWQYRKAFWKAYLDDIGYTKVILGPIAEQKAKLVAKNKLLDYGRLVRAYDKTQSLLIFSIGPYVFMEVSHNGSLRIWREGESPFSFLRTNVGREEYSYDDIIHGYFQVKTFVHSSPETYSWQCKVSDWIAEECNIYKTIHQWGVK